MSSKRVLVTGATGFVGSNLTQLLLDRGQQVRVLVRPSSDRRNLFNHASLEICEGDLRNFDSVTRATHGCEEIFHVAADYRFWVANPRELYDSNVLGTRNLLQAAQLADVSKVIYTSTVGTIGLANQPEPCHEQTANDPHQWSSHYKRSKLQAEQLALEAAKNGQHVVVVNPSTPIGRWDRKPTPTGKIIVDFVQGKMPAYVHTGLNFVHVRDVAEGHWLAAQKGRSGERYILGNQNLTMAEFLKLLAHVTDIKPPRIRIPYALAYVAGAISTGYANWITRKSPAIDLEAVKMSRRFMFFDSSKAQRELGLPQTPLESAAQEAVDWFSQQGYFDRRPL